uniref:RING-type domain-containing protein n=1 Tax=viral metagenome TaxID=1070528 RepID=A0A6C0EK60_9ZZZZ
MSRLHQQTSSICSVCNSELQAENAVVLHKTRRQTHALCFDCAQGYFSEPLQTMINNLRRNIRSNVHIRCPGTYHSNVRNQCKHNIDVTKLKIPEACSEMHSDLFRISYVLQSPIAFLCPNLQCKNVVDIDDTYVGNRVSCLFCSTTWCRQCRISPYHTEKTCLEYEIEEKKGENAKMIWEMSQQGNVKFCPNCKSPTLRHEERSCNKITCTSCGVKWCWLCGKGGIDYDHFNDPNNNCNNKLWEGSSIM